MPTIDKIFLEPVVKIILEPTALKASTIQPILTRERRNLTLAIRDNDCPRQALSCEGNYA
jgi:hypothetical protein